ncbi:MAG: hypothetical protein ACXW2W_11230 [Telluria sp.]
MYPIEKILVTGDFIRQSANGGSSQNGNIRWLFNLIRPALEISTAIPCSPLFFGGGAGCAGSRIYEANNLPSDFNSWIKLFNKSPSARDLAIIHDVFDGALVVAFELPEIIRKGLDALGILYVDFTIHPARFLDDLIFGARSNISGFASALTQWVTYDDEIHIHAGLAMASLSKLPPIKECIGGESIAIFAGQTSDDKVLIKGDRLMGVDEFMSSFAEISANHDKILVKPHPYAKNNPIILALTRLFPNTQLVESNFYHLLAHDNVQYVYSITSSTSIEAAYFGKQGRHLAPYPYYFTDQDTDSGAYLTIRPELYLPEFWAAILNIAGARTNDARPIRISPDRNRMRRSLRNSWGADIFEFKG